MIGVRIRPAKPGEAVLLGRIGFDSWMSSPLRALDAGRTDTTKLLSLYIKFCADTPMRILVAEIARRPVGWGARETGDNYIPDLWIAPDSQRRGAGGALLGALETDIGADGFGRVELECSACNLDALRFYRRHGFRPVWRGEKFAPALGYVIDKERLAKALNAPDFPMQERTNR